MPILIRAAGLAVAAWLTCSFARAQSAPSELIPPVAQTSTDVAYPAGAEGDAAVVLELVIEKDGAVSTAKVVEGVEPFAEQARAAALTWLFTPAQRDHPPVAARIRARVEFHRDAEPASPDSAADPAAPP